jgi:hypothetical protein
MDSWIYRRTSLAKHYIEALDIGMTRLALFAPRRRGKTLFLINDLAPMAEELGYRPVYANLWDNVDSPHIPILESLRKSYDTLRKRGRLTSLLTTPITKLTIGSGIVKGDLHFAKQPTAPTRDELTEISDLIDKIANLNKKKSLLLLIDEVQHITTHEKFSPLAFTLRTAADKNSKKLRMVFTGSSRTGMNLLFNKSNAAFYQSVERFEFPNLDDNFLIYCQKKLKKDYKIATDFEDLEACFDELDKSPYWFIKVLHKMILHKISLSKSLTLVMDNIIEAEGYLDIYKKLKPLDKLVMVAIGTNMDEIFSESVVNKFTEVMRKKIKVSTVQYTVKKLEALQLITKMSRGEYVIEQPSLRSFIMGRLEEE